MGLFEEYPAALVLVVLAVVGAYDAAKWLVRRQFEAERAARRKQSFRE